MTAFLRSFPPGSLSLPRSMSLNPMRFVCWSRRGTVEFLWIRCLLLNVVDCGDWIPQSDRILAGSCISHSRQPKLGPGMSSYSDAWGSGSEKKSMFSLSTEDHIYSPCQNDVIPTKIISELISKNMSSQLQQINSPRINFISTFLSQQFWAGFGSGRARWVRASLYSEHARKSPQKIPKTRCQQKIAISKILNQKYLNKKIWPNYFPKNVISNSTINFFELILT